MNTKLKIAELPYGNNSCSIIIDDKFFNEYPVNNVDSSAKCNHCEVKCNIEKSPTMIKIDFLMTIFYTFICDITCKEFKEKIQLSDFIIAKYKPNISSFDKNLTKENLGINENIMYFDKNDTYLDLSQEFYDIIVTSIPMKKLDYSVRNTERNQKYVYQTKEIDETTDDRFSVLKNLINN